jgi:hypothetical protein
MVSNSLLQVVGMNWIEVPPGKYKLLKGKERKSHCQIELSVKYAIHLGVFLDGTEDEQI